MPDPYTNARPYYDVSFPNSGDGFSIAGTKNALQGLGFMDFIPLQPRAHNPANLSIMVRGRDASAYYNPIYFGDSNARVFFNSGDSAAMSAPASNPRIDIVYLTPSGDIKIATGTEAATPNLPTLAPSGDSRIPICAVYHRTTETKIVNFEDKDSNTGDGYIYQDLRPFLKGPGGTGTSAVLTSAAALNVTGDNAVGTANTAARADHTHQGVHAIRKVGSSNMYGDVEFSGTDITQTAGRLAWAGETVKSYLTWDSLNSVIRRSFNIASITKTGTGTWTIIFATALASQYFSITGMSRQESSNVNTVVSIEFETDPTTTAIDLEILAGGSASDPTLTCFMVV